MNVLVKNGGCKEIDAKINELWKEKKSYYTQGRLAFIQKIERLNYEIQGLNYKKMDPSIGLELGNIPVEVSKMNLNDRQKIVELLKQIDSYKEMINSIYTPDGPMVEINKYFELQTNRLNNAIKRDNQIPVEQAPVKPQQQIHRASRPSRTTKTNTCRTTSTTTTNASSTSTNTVATTRYIINNDSSTTSSNKWYISNFIKDSNYPIRIKDGRVYLNLNGRKQAKMFNFNREDIEQAIFAEGHIRWTSKIYANELATLLALPKNPKDIVEINSVSDIFKNAKDLDLIDLNVIAGMMEYQKY